MLISKFFTRALMGAFLIIRSASALAADNLTMPTQPRPLDSKALFPECKIPDVNPLPSLRRCRSDLEVFRESTLEGYNKKIKRYIENLKSQDSMLQLRLAAKSISLAEYQKLHEKIASGLAVAGPDGELMESYFDGVIHYQKLANWVISEIENIELKLIQPP